jgi:hypothetical protein
MNAIIEIYRPASRFMPRDRNPSDRVGHLVVVNVSGPCKPGPTLPAYKLVAHDRYPWSPMLVPIGIDGEVALWCGPSGNLAGSECTAGWCEAVRRITGGFSVLVPIYDDGFEGGV